MTVHKAVKRGNATYYLITKGTREEAAAHVAWFEDVTGKKYEHHFRPYQGTKYNPALHEWCVISEA